MQLTIRARVVGTMVIAVALAAATAARADARSRTEADDAIAAKLLGHADALSAIVERHLDRPDKAVPALEKYLKKHRKAMKKLAAQLAQAARELDDGERRAWARALMFDERAQRFVAAVSELVDRHGEDATWGKRVQARVDELLAEGQKLAAAFLR